LNVGRQPPGRIRALQQYGEISGRVSPGFPSLSIRAQPTSEVARGEYKGRAYGLAGAYRLTSSGCRGLRRWPAAHTCQGHQIDLLALHRQRQQASGGAHLTPEAEDRALRALRAWQKGRLRRHLAATENRYSALKHLPQTHRLPHRPADSHWPIGDRLGDNYRHYAGRVSRMRLSPDNARRGVGTLEFAVSSSPAITIATHHFLAFLHTIAPQYFPTILNSTAAKYPQIVGGLAEVWRCRPTPHLPLSSCDPKRPPLSTTASKRTSKRCQSEL